MDHDEGMEYDGGMGYDGDVVIDDGIEFDANLMSPQYPYSILPQPFQTDRNAKQDSLHDFWTNYRQL